MASKPWKISIARLYNVVNLIIVAPGLAGGEPVGLVYNTFTENGPSQYYALAESAE